MSSLSNQAITARDSMAKSLYSALFDWIVLRINHALLNKKDMEESIPVRENDSNTYTTTQICQNIILSLSLGFQVMNFPVLYSFLSFLLFFSVCPSVFWTFLALRTLRPTASSSSASTMQTNSCNIISTTIFSIWSR